MTEQELSERGRDPGGPGVRAEGARRGLGTAIAGGLVGALVMAVALLFVVPEYFASRLVRSGLLAEPQILTETLEALRDAQYAPVLAANRATLERPFANSWKGASNADVTLVEFFDYACPYCKSSNPHVDRLLAEDKGLRIVYRELPILGPDSLAAARLSLQASKRGQFLRFHDTLWATGRPSPEANAAAARAAGIPPVPQADPEVEAELKRNFQLAGQLGATGTPLFIVGDKVLNGAVGYDALKQAVAEARKKSRG